MSAILKFDFQKREQLRFSEENYLNYTKKTQLFVCGNYIFPTRENKNKPWTHSTPLKPKTCQDHCELYETGVQEMKAQCWNNFFIGIVGILTISSIHCNYLS